MKLCIRGCRIFVAVPADLSLSILLGLPGDLSTVVGGRDV